MTVRIVPDLCWGLTLGRGGSRGLPGKNIRELGGHPLIAWAVAVGKLAGGVDRVLCSTDDAEIARAAADAGADVPFRRPSSAADSAATDLDVFSHLIEWHAERGADLPEFFVQLRPTTPFREPEWIDRAIARMKADRSITCMRSVTPTPITPYKMWRSADGDRLMPAMELPGVDEAYNLPRQSLPEILWHTGQIDVIRTETLLGGSMTGANIHALHVPLETAIDIDGADDFHLAEIKFRETMPAALGAYLATAEPGRNDFA